MIQVLVQPSWSQYCLQFCLCSSFNLDSFSILFCYLTYYLCILSFSISICFSLQYVGLCLPICLHLRYHHLCLRSYLLSLKFSISINTLLFSDSSLSYFWDLFLGISLNDMILSFSFLDINLEEGTNLGSFLDFTLFDEFNFSVIVKKSDVKFMSSLFILIHWPILSFVIKGFCYIRWQFHVGYNNSGELKTLGGKHLVQKLQHLLCVVPSDCIDFKMGLTSNKDSESLRKCCFQLLIQLVNTNIVCEIFDRVLVVLAPEDHTDIYFYKDVIKGGAWLDHHIVNDILLSDQVLNSGLQVFILNFYPGQAPVHPSFFHHLLKLSMLSDNSVCSFWSIQ